MHIKFDEILLETYLRKWQDILRLRDAIGCAYHDYLALFTKLAKYGILLWVWVKCKIKLQTR